MKKVLTGIGLSIVMLATTVAPVLADKPDEPGDNRPVAWVKWNVNTASNELAPVDQMASGLVILLDDRTTVGNWVYHNLDNGTGGYIISFIDSETKFYEAGGGKVADFKAWVYVEKDSVTGKPQTARWWFQMVDNGEPSRGVDAQQIWIWLPYLGIPMPIWWPMYGPQNRADPSFGLPVPVNGGGNFQVHITDGYDD